MRPNPGDKFWLIAPSIESEAYGVPFAEPWRGEVVKVDGDRVTLARSGGDGPDLDSNATAWVTRADELFGTEAGARAAYVGRLRAHAEALRQEADAVGREALRQEAVLAAGRPLRSLQEEWLPMPVPSPHDCEPSVMVCRVCRGTWDRYSQEKHEPGCRHAELVRLLVGQWSP